jgi:hypothetical protein
MLFYFFSRSSKLILPLSSVATTTTVQPHITAVAGLVPCAEAGTQGYIAVTLTDVFLIGADRLSYLHTRLARRSWVAAGCSRTCRPSEVAFEFMDDLPDSRRPG